MKNKIVYLLSIVLLGTLIFNPWGYNISELPKQTFFIIFAAVVLLILCSRFLVEGEAKIRFNKAVFIAVALWTISLCISTIFSMAPQLSFWGSYDRMQGLYSNLIYVIFFLIFLNFFDLPKKQEIFIKILLGFSFFAAIYAIFQKFGFDIFPKELIVKKEFFGRSFATLGHPNFLGQFLLFPIWGAVYFFIKEKKNKRILHLVLFGLFVIALIFTQNRASLLGLTIGAFAFILIGVNIKKIYKYLISAGLILSFAGFITFFASSMRSLFERFYIWEGAYKAFLKNPIIGSGLETFRQIFQKSASADIYKFENINNVADRAHNIFLDVLVTQGAFGFLIFLSLMIAVFYLIFRNIEELKKNKLLLISAAIFISVLVSNFFSFSMSVHMILMAFLLAVILNNTVRFKRKTIKKTWLTVSIVVAIGIVSALMIINTSFRFYSDIQFKKGLEYFSEGQFKESIYFIAKSASNNPHQSEISIRTSDLLYVLGTELNSKEALEEAKIPLVSAGRFLNYDFQYYFLKARIEEALGNYENAESMYREATHLAPTNRLILEKWDEMIRKQIIDRP